MVSEQEIKQLYNSNQTDLSPEVYKHCVDFILDAKKECQKKCVSSDVAKVCLDFLRGFAYLAVAFDSEAMASTIGKSTGCMSMKYCKKIDDCNFLYYFFHSMGACWVGRFWPLSEDYGGEFDPTFDSTNSFVGLFYHLAFYCQMSYSDKNIFPRYSRDETFDYLRSILNRIEDYGEVSTQLSYLSSSLEWYLESIKKGIALLCAGKDHSVFDKCLQVEVARGVPTELWEHLEDKYRDFLADAHAGIVVGPNLSVNQVAEILNYSPQRIYQLMDSGKLEFLERNSEENLTNQRMIEYGVVRDYLENTTNMSGMEYQHSLDRLNRYGHLEVEWRDDKKGGECNMSKGHGVSGYTHTQEQLDSYANQMNPNNDAYQADLDNHANQMNPEFDDSSDDTE